MRVLSHYTNLSDNNNKKLRSLKVRSFLLPPYSIYLAQKCVIGSVSR